MEHPHLTLLNHFCNSLQECSGGLFSFSEDIKHAICVQFEQQYRCLGIWDDGLTSFENFESFFLDCVREWSVSLETESFDSSSLRRVVEYWEVTLDKFNQLHNAHSLWAIHWFHPKHSVELEKRLKECETIQQKIEITEGTLECKNPMCRSKKTFSYQMQTRSADEGMTTYVICSICQKRFKF